MRRLMRPQEDSMTSPRTMTYAQLEDRIRRSERAVRRAMFDGRYADARRHEDRAWQLQREMERRQ